MSDSLHINRSEAVLELKLNRPDRRNAIAPDTARQLAAVLQDAHLDPAVRAVLITGEGRDFCTGADVAGSDQAGKMAPLDFRWATRDFYAMNRALWEIEKPVVSAVNGTVAGAGSMKMQKGLAPYPSIPGWGRCCSPGRSGAPTPWACDGSAGRCGRQPGTRAKTARRSRWPPC